MANTESPDPLFTLRGNMTAIHSLSFQLLCNGSEYLYASTQSGHIHKWNLKSCREENQMESGKEACLAVKYLQGFLITQSKGGKIRIWENNKCSWTVRSELSFNYFGFSKFDTIGDQYIVCADYNSRVKILTVNGGNLVKTICLNSEKKLGEVMVIKCITKNRTNYIFVLYESGLLVLFDSGGNAISQFQVAECPMALDFDGDVKGVLGTSGDAIIGFQLTSALAIVKWKETVLTNPGISCLAIRPDKKLVAAGCWDSRIRLFSMKSLKLLVVLTSHRAVIQDICYSPSRVQAWNTDWLLVAGGKDGRITLWNLY